MLLALIERQFEQEMRCGAALFLLRDHPRPFLKVEALFALLMCPACQAACSSSNRGSAEHRVEMIDPDQPSELLAHHDPGEPWLKWRWPIPGCGHPVMRPRDREPHTAAEHAGWSASWHASRCGVSTAVNA